MRCIFIISIYIRHRKHIRKLGKTVYKILAWSLLENQKYFKIFPWFSNHLLHIDHRNITFSYIYTIEMWKSSLWKTSRWNAKSIYTINENNNKNNNKNQDRITKPFEKAKQFYLSNNWNILWYTFSDITPFNLFEFSWFERSVNALKVKASASKGFYFCFLLLANL